MNERFLRHRGPTDVLSFDLSEIRLPNPKSEIRNLDAQIVVSADAARRRAGALGHSILAELGLYVAHGLLHLLGYDDHRSSDRERDACPAERAARSVRPAAEGVARGMTNDD